MGIFRAISCLTIERVVRIYCHFRRCKDCNFCEVAFYGFIFVTHILGIYYVSYIRCGVFGLSSVGSLIHRVPAQLSNQQILSPRKQAEEISYKSVCVSTLCLVIIRLASSKRSCSVIFECLVSHRNLPIRFLNFAIVKINLLFIDWKQSS